MARFVLRTGGSQWSDDGLWYVYGGECPGLLLVLISWTVLGKAEGTGAEWHGHVTAITVAPEYRRLSLARKMMSFLEHVSDETYKGFFVDLYVRCANVVAIEMYEGMGYSAYRRVREYYGTLGQGKGGKDEEDAFGT